MASLYFEMNLINFSSCSSESNDEIIMGLDFPSSKKMYFMVSGKGFCSNSDEFPATSNVSESPTMVVV